jgi:type VI protein secretion system component Hcp
MAAAVYFLKIDGVPGDSTDPDHPGQTELMSCQVLETPIRDKSGNRSALETEIHATFKRSKASPQLSQSQFTGDLLSKVYLEVSHDKGTLLYRLTLSKVRVEAFQSHYEDTDYMWLVSRDQRWVYGCPTAHSALADHKAHIYKTRDGASCRGGGR